MKILVVCERADAEGGTETYLRTVLPALRARGHELCVVARIAAQPLAYGTPAHIAAWSDEHDAPSAAAAASVAEIARAFAPDVASVHNVLDSGVLDAVRRSVGRVVYHLHDHRPFCPNGDRLYPQGGAICAVAMGGACVWHALIHGCAYGPHRRTLGLIALRQGVERAVAQGDAVVVFSRYMANLAARNGIAPDRTHAIAPPLEDVAFCQAPAARPPRDTVLFAGRVVPSKGARSLVAALARIEVPLRPRLHLAGDGPDLSATLERARALEVDARALGRLDAAAMRAAYDSATIVAMPSLWGEPFGLVGIEAFARGRPVAAYDAGAIGEWLAAGGGHAVALANQSALADAIARLLDGAAWREASAHARSAAQAYRLTPHVQQLEAIYAGREMPA